MADNILNYLIGAAWTGGKATKDATRDIKGMGAAGDKTEKQIKGTTETTSKFGSTLRGLVGAGVILAAGKQLLQFGAASIAAASDVEEMQSKFNVVFAQEGPRVTAALDEFAGAANRSKTELMGYAATLQDTFVPLGFARDASADMSIQLVKLAEDLASFNNLNTADVVRDLQSALVGNTETLRKYGVVAQETQIKQEALALGLWDGKGAIDAQAKANAILSLTLKGTTDAQGDAINTADSYANVSKGLEAAVLDLKVAIGENLLPAMTETKAATAGLLGSSADWLSSINAINAAVADGTITFEEGEKVKRQMALTSYEAADAMDYLNDKYAEAAELTAVYTDELDNANLAYRRAAVGGYDYENALLATQLAHLEGLEPSHNYADALYDDEAAADRAAFAARRLASENRLAAGATETHSSSLITLRDRLAEVEGQRTAQADLQVYGLDSLQKANRLLESLRGFNANDQPDPYATGGDRDYGDQYDRGGDRSSSSTGSPSGRDQYFAVGGVVSGRLGRLGRDSVVARLTPGEEILRRDDPRHVLNSGGGRAVHFNGPLIGTVIQQPGENTAVFAQRTADNLMQALMSVGNA